MDSEDEITLKPSPEEFRRRRMKRNPSLKLKIIRTTPPRISSVPGDLIRKICSYLSESEYMAFSKTNKEHHCVYRSSPIPIVQLTANEFGRRDQWLKHYPNLKSLHIDDFHVFVKQCTLESISRHCRQLRTLRISASDVNTAFDKFLVQQNAESGCSNRIELLELSGFISPTHLYWLLGRLPALTKLHLCYARFREHLDIDVLRTLCSNLNELMLDNKGGFPARILTAFHLRVKTFALCEPRALDIDSLSNYDWTKLERLYIDLSEGVAGMTNRLLSKMKGLKEIALGVKDMYDATLFGNLFADVITNHPQMEFLCIEYRKVRVLLSEHVINWIIRNIIRGLLKSREQVRDVLEISLRNLNPVRDWNTVMWQLRGLFSEINRTKTQRWMVSMRSGLEGTVELQPMKEAVGLLLNSCTGSDSNIKLLLMTEQLLVFGNGGDAVLDRHDHWWRHLRPPRG